METVGYGWEWGRYMGMGWDGNEGDGMEWDGDSVHLRVTLVATRRLYLLFSCLLKPHIFNVILVKK